MYHPSPAKLYAVLKRADESRLTEETRNILEDISRRCHTCQVHASAPVNFKIRTPTDVKFNRDLRLDLMFLDSRQPVLHVVDDGTNFQAAAFLPGEDAASVWNTFVLCWSRMYLGDPDRIVTDQGSVFISKEFGDQCAAHEILLEHTGVESHSSLGQGETYHSALRTTYEKLKAQHPGIPREVLLQCAVYAINTSTGPDGLIPCLLVFGALPKLPGLPATHAVSNRARFALMETARAEYARWVARARIARGLNTHVPQAADETFVEGDSVYVFREKPRRWSGPHEVLRVEGKSIVACVDSTGPKSFNVAKCKRALTAVDIRWTETLLPGDPRCNDAKMDEAKKKEITGLIARGTFKIAVLPDSHDENVIPTRFVLAIKHEDGKVIYKARFVVGGHRDKLKGRMIHTASALSQTSVRIVLSVAAILGFHVWTTDVAQAYLQSASRLRRRIFCRPDVLELGKNEYLQLMLPLYGLTEAGDYWGETLTEHCIRDCKFTQSASDLSLFFRHVGRKLVGVSGNYVDDLLRAAPQDYRAEMEAALRSRFDCKPSKNLPTEFLGLTLAATRSGFSLGMASYITRLQALPPAASYADFASLRACILWISHARPDIAAYASLCSSVTRQTLKASDIWQMNQRLKYLQDTADVVLHYPSLDVDSLQLIVYSDAGFANRDDRSSQLGFVICLADKHHKMCILSYRSAKSWRVVRSAMAAETLAFVAAFDCVFSVRHTLNELLRRSIPILMLVDSKNLFDVMTKNRRTTEARLMVDVHAARQSYRRKEINNIGLIRSEHNLADCLTKLNGNAALLDAMRSSSLEHPIQDFVCS